MAEFQPYDVSIPYAGLAERFEQWVREQGWVLSDIVNVEGSDRPMRFVQPSFGPPPVPRQAEVTCSFCKGPHSIAYCQRWLTSRK